MHISNDKTTLFQKQSIFILYLIFSCLSLAASPADRNDSCKFSALYVDLIAYSADQWQGGYLLSSNRTPFENHSQYPAILTRQPAFSWSLTTSSKAYRQKAYQILVADNRDALIQLQGNIWDSGKVPGQHSAGIPFEGKSLRPKQPYYWKVNVWNERGEKTASDVSVFYTGDLQDGYGTARYPLQRTDQHPQHLRKQTDGLYSADFGRAAFSQLRLSLSSAVDGDTIIIHLGEALDEKGRINKKPGGTIRYQAYHLGLKKGTHSYQLQIRSDKRNTGPQAVLMPTYIGEVLPFRYVELEGYTENLQKEQILRSMVHYPFDDEAAYFSSSNDTLNQIWALCKYSVKATTFAGLYVDGDRERIPYEADAYINQLCHYAVDNEYTLARYSHEYLIKHATWPTEWILQSVLMAYNDYLYTGDLRSVSHYYDDLKAKTLTLLEEPNGLISTRTGKQGPALMQAIHFNGDSIRDIVDWPHGGILGLGSQDPGESDGFVFTDFNTVVNAYYYKALADMGKLAYALGKADEGHFYAEKANKVYRAFQKYFFRKDRGNYQDGIGTDHASLHSNMFALAFNLVPEKYKAKVMEYVRSRGLACSVYGSQFLMDAIYRSEDADYGLSLLTSTAERSWYNMIREGSTMTMEAWGNKFKPNQDWNHVWGAVPANIIPRKLMGIEPTQPAWETFDIKPQLGDLAFAAIKVPTIKGPVSMEVKQLEGRFDMLVDVPANTRADIYIPVKTKRKKVSLWVDGRSQRLPVHNGWGKLVGVPSGKYHIWLSDEF
ncbi:family 78 glycoside hydrolase catalytic domain [Olivibacter sp. CPCC 100613]|uniref:family 78 glycoside hydrolase catalytic domain n=1 Tax=Olivibacter sp. CPCC 100613 TaxID=3079931 RepID=UPI002FF668ED